MQSANGSLSSDDRGYLNTEYTALKDEVTRIQGSAKFGETALVDTGTTSVGFQIGLGTETTDVIDLDFGGLDLSTVLGGDVTDVANSQQALDDIDEAIGLVSDKRATFGAAMNRMEITTANIQTMKLNLESANSRIVDVDVASETARMSRNQVLTQAGVSVLAQANQLPQLAFGLIG
jgi:flagellin